LTNLVVRPRHFDIKTPNMKSLKSAFLVAAAATATQLDATDFRLEYSGTINSNSANAVAIVGIDLPNLTAALSTGVPSWITSFSMTVTGAGAANGTYGLADINNVFFLAPVTPDYTTEILGQPGFIGFVFWATDNSKFSGSGAQGIVFDSSFLANLISFAPAPPSAPAGVADQLAWMSSINGANRTYMIGSTLAGLPLEGAHHRPMLSFDRMGKESQAWATGDFGSSSRTRDVHVTSGEAGINWNLGKSFLFGVAGGHAVQNQDLAFGGSSATKGDFAIAELDYRPEGTQWIVSLLGMVGSWESKTHRGYTSGGATDSSFGIADTITRSARLRVDAPSLVTFGGFGFAPYASYTVTQTIVGAYTETGGAFPASFNEQEHNATEGRAGITASKDLSAATKLLLTVEAIHRFDGAGPALTGQDITGGISFNIAGIAPRKDCVRFGFDVDHKLSADTLLNISAHVSTVGEAHDVSAAISIRRAF
jgi:uncharacterized protein with beta-barrel porin domain